MDAIVRQEGTSPDNIQTEESLAEDIAQQLQAHGYDKSSDQCKEQWQYMVKTYCHGGYQNFKSQINLVYLCQPSVIKSAIFDPENSLKSQNHQCVWKDEKVLDFSDPKDTILKSNKIQPENSSLDVDLASQGQKENNTEKVMDKIINSSINISNGYECLDFVCDTTECSETQLRSNNNEICEDSNIIKNNVCHAKEQMESNSAPKKQENRYSNGVECEKLKESSHDETEVYKTKSRIKAKVLSISEFPESKIIMCQVQKNEATQVLKLHYPLSYNIPNNIRYLYIPKNILCPEYKLQTVEPNTDSCNRESEATENTSLKPEESMQHKTKMKATVEMHSKNKGKKYSSSKRNIDMKREDGRDNKETRGESSRCTKRLKQDVYSSEKPVRLKVQSNQQGISPSHHKESIRGDESIEEVPNAAKSIERVRQKKEKESQDVLQLAEEYYQQCDREDDRLASLMKESQEEFAMDFQRVLSAFQELSDFL